MFEPPQDNWHLAVAPGHARDWRRSVEPLMRDRAVFVHASGKFVFLPIEASHAGDVIAAGDTITLRIGNGGEFTARCIEAQVWETGIVFKAEPASDKRDSND